MAKRAKYARKSNGQFGSDVTSKGRALNTTKTTSKTLKTRKVKGTKSKKGKKSLSATVIKK